ADDFGRTRSVFHDIHRRHARFFQIWRLRSEPVQAGAGVGDSGGNRLIHFVCQEAVSSPMVVTRLTCARSACAWRNASSARLFSDEEAAIASARMKKVMQATASAKLV